MLFEAGLKCSRTLFNPKPAALAGAMNGRSIALPAVASGFGLNDDTLASSPASDAIREPCGNELRG